MVVPPSHIIAVFLVNGPHRSPFQCCVPALHREHLCHTRSGIPNCMIVRLRPNSIAIT